MHTATKRIAQPILASVTMGALAISFLGSAPSQAAQPANTSLSASDAQGASQKNSPEVQAQAAKIKALREGQKLTFTGADKAQITVTKEKGQLRVETPYDGNRSVCGTTIATAITGLGAVGLFALAATLGPGEIAVVAGVEMTAEQLGFAAGSIGSFSALSAWADSKFCQ